MRRRRQPAAAAAGCSLLRPTGTRRRLAVVRTDLARLRAAAHRSGGTVNDVLLVAVGGALHSVLRQRGESVGSVVISVPVATRPATTTAWLGNRVSFMLVPVDAAGATAERVARIAAATRARKAAAIESRPAAMTGPLFRLAARIGLVHRYMARQRQLHTLVSNMRGPGSPVTFAGAAVAGIVPVAVGDTGNVTLSVDVLSYAGTVSITLVADPDGVPDLARVVTALGAELDTVTAEPARVGTP